MKLIDTNVLVYAAGRAHPWKVPCADLCRAASARHGAFTVDAEVLQELLHLYAGRGESQRGAELVSLVLDLFPAVIPIGPTEVRRAAALLVQYPRLSARDAIHAAVVALHGLEGIVSVDTDFDAVREVRRYDPLRAAAE